MQNDDSPARGKKLLRILCIILLVAAIVGILLFALNIILPGFLETLEHGDQQEIEGYIRSFGTTRGMLLAFLLQFMQILSIFFPGGPIQIAIGVVFGTLPGFLICHVSYVLANLFVFGLARRLGSRIDHLLDGNKRSGKLSFISESKHPAFMVMLACLMPFLPNGLVPYIASRTKLTPGKYLLAVWAGSIPCLLLLNAIGSKLASGQYIYVGILCAIFAAFVLLMVFRREAIFALAERFRRWVLDRFDKTNMRA